MGRVTHPWVRRVGERGWSLLRGKSYKKFVKMNIYINKMLLFF